MGYSLLNTLGEMAVLLFTVGIAGTVVFRLLTGGIQHEWHFLGRRNDGSMYLSAERVQGLLSTLAIAMLYLLNAAHATNV
jgi:hypothetical protein